MSDIAIVRQRLVRDRKKTAGTTCPCCDQHVEEYTRNLRPSSASWLLALYVASEIKEWNHSQDISRLVDYRSGGEFSIMKWWRFIASEAGGENKRETNGLWRITQTGRQFCRGILSVSKTVRLYNDTLLGFEGPSIDMLSALGTTQEEFSTLLARLKSEINS